MRLRVNFAPAAAWPTAGLALAATLLAGCASDRPSAPGAASTSPTTQTSPTASADPSAREAAMAAALRRAYEQFVAKTPPANTPTVSGALGAKPRIAKPQGAAPKKMVVKDIAVGTGATAPVDATVTVDYVGVRWDNGREFDTSFGKAPVTFPLGNLIAGWQIGIPGMKEGGRRELVIPADLAYGPAGSGHELAGQTLVFVIDLKKVAG